MPILTQTRRMIVDEETRLHFDELRAQKKLRNSTHLVIMKDLKTGHVRSFISVFVGSYDYLKKTKRMSRNSYLYREKDFDGKVLFFKLNGSMINGWKYRDGKIVGKIMPIDEDTKILMTRSGGYWEEQCYTETYYEEVEECEEESQPYYDEEFGLWGVETVVTCQKVDKPIYTQVCEEVWVEDEEFGGGVDPDDEDLSVVAPKTTKIFRNSKMTEENWKVIEKMLDKITENSMGLALYNGLKSVLNGKTLAIQFITSGNSSFDLGGAGIRLRMDVESGQFLHEMLHAYQAYNETYGSMREAKLNMEIETHYAQYLYQSSLPEYGGSKWEYRDKSDSRWKEIKGLEDFIDEKGNLHPGINIADLESIILNNVVPTLRKGGYPEDRYPLDYDRLGLENFKNIRELTKNCE